MKVDIVNTDNKKVGSLELNDEVFGGRVNDSLIWESVVHTNASARRGTHKTKNRANVAGSGRKPWKQKGTGRARQGSIRAPQWKGGGKPFGPTPRSYAKAMPREMRREALRAAVAAKIADGGLRVVESVTTDGKTKSLVASLAALGVAEAPTLLVVASLADTLARAARNVAWLTVETPTHVSVYQLLHATHVVFERAGFTALEEALA